MDKRAKLDVNKMLIRLPGRSFNVICALILSLTNPFQNKSHQVITVWNYMRCNQ